MSTGSYSDRDYSQLPYQQASNPRNKELHRRKSRSVNNTTIRLQEKPKNYVNWRKNTMQVSLDNSPKKLHRHASQYVPTI